MTPIPQHSNGFRWFDADAYLFDIDGTLLNNGDHVHYNALNQAMLDVYGVDSTIAGIAYHGKTDVGILRAALERAGVSTLAFEAKLSDALESVRSHVRDNAHTLTPRVCAGIPEVLAQVKAAGKLIGIASGNLESVGWQKVKATGLQDFFQFGCFCDQRELRKDIFRQAVAEVHTRLGYTATACFIGDTPDDIQAAQHAGARVIAVGTGIFKPEDLGPYQPDVCVASCAELIAERG
ncbi:MAG: HAD family hydrolase [Acidobacteriia bacterium]|nr:HAD family hydrolase [Terriglobia bacterium]